MLWFSLDIVKDTKIAIIIIGNNISYKCQIGKTLSVPKIESNYLGGHVRYGMSSGEMKSLWRVTLKDINATMASKHNEKGRYLDLENKGSFYCQFFVKGLNSRLGWRNQ